MMSFWVVSSSTENRFNEVLLLLVVDVVAVSRNNALFTEGLGGDSVDATRGEDVIGIGAKDSAVPMIASIERARRRRDNDEGDVMVLFLYS